MPKDEKKGGDAAAKTAELEKEKGECAAALLTNFAQACKLTGFPASKVLEEALQFPAASAEVERDLCTLTARGALGAPNVRALCAAVLARGTGLAPKPYKFLKRLVLQELHATPLGGHFGRDNGRLSDGRPSYEDRSQRLSSQVLCATPVGRHAIPTPNTTIEAFKPTATYAAPPQRFIGPKISYAGS